MKKKAVKKKVVKKAPQVTGKVVMGDLSKVSPNDWNPNEFDDYTWRSLVHGLKEDGWLAAQALLIWRTDENGEEKNLIIDGEHRWKGATELGMKRGPMVFLDGLTRAEAMALTVKLDNKRGKFNPAKLVDVLKTVREELKLEDFNLSMGYTPNQVDRLLKKAADDGTPNLDLSKMDGGPSSDSRQRSTSEHVKRVNLSFDEEQHSRFSSLAQKAAADLGTSSHSDTILALLEQNYGGAE